MKIVGKSNFDLDNVNDILVAENVNLEYADRILDFINDKFTSSSSGYYFFLEKDDYKLYKFEP
jgi:hypothetical protein